MSAFPWPLPILAWGHLFPKLPTDPPDLFQPPCLCSHHASSWVFYLPSPKLTLGEHKSFNAGISFFFSRSFLTLPFPGAWEGRSAWSQTGVLLCGRPKPLEVCVALYL